MYAHHIIGVYNMDAVGKRPILVVKKFENNFFLSPMCLALTRRMFFLVSIFYLDLSSIEES